MVLILNCAIQNGTVHTIFQRQLWVLQLFSLMKSWTALDSKQHAQSTLSSHHTGSNPVCTIWVVAPVMPWLVVVIVDGCCGPADLIASQTLVCYKFGDKLVPEHTNPISFSSYLSEQRVHLCVSIGPSKAYRVTGHILQMRCTAVMFCIEFENKRLACTDFVPLETGWVCYCHNPFCKSAQSPRKHSQSPKHK